MAEIKSGTLDEIIDRRDVTELKDRGLPKSWKCPHCGKRNKMDKFAEELLMRYFKVFRHCENCGYVHMWELTLTENFKNEVVQFLLQEMRKEDAKTNTVINTGDAMSTRTNQRGMDYYPNCGAKMDEVEDG